jgi:hypothetical protein
LRRICVGEIIIFGKEDLILECAQHVVRKKHVEKEGKATCRRKRNMVHKKTILIVIWLGFLIRILIAISL